MSALQRCLDHRASLATPNPHLIVTTQTKPRTTPASTAYLTHVLDPAGIPPKRLRSTRLVDLVVSLDPKVVSEALGMKAEGLVDYLADDVDGRLDEPASRTCVRQAPPCTPSPEPVRFRQTAICGDQGGGVLVVAVADNVEEGGGGVAGHG